MDQHVLAPGCANVHKHLPGRSQVRDSQSHAPQLWKSSPRYLGFYDRACAHLHPPGDLGQKAALNPHLETWLKDRNLQLPSHFEVSLKAIRYSNISSSKGHALEWPS